MSTLPELLYRKLPVQVVYTTGTPTVAETLNAIYNALKSTSYADRTPRTPGSGTAWDVSRYQNGGTTEALYAKAPLAAISTMDIILAGVDSGAPTPTMLTPDSFSTGYMLVGINKGGSGFNAWDNAAPFTSGNFSGYWRGFNCANAFWIYVYESLEDLWIFAETVAGVLATVRVGAFIDPLTSHASDAETSGRIYAMVSSGTGSVSTNFWDTNGPFAHAVSANVHHFGSFTPGAGTITLLTLVTSFTNTGRNCISPGLSPKAVPVGIRDFTTPFNFVGWLRGAYTFNKARHGEEMYDKNNNEKFYLISGHRGADNYLAAALPRY